MKYEDLASELIYSAKLLGYTQEQVFNFIGLSLEDVNKSILIRYTDDYIIVSLITKNNSADELYLDSKKYSLEEIRTFFYNWIYN